MSPYLSKYFPFHLEQFSIFYLLCKGRTLVFTLYSFTRIIDEVHVQYLEIGLYISLFHRDMKGDVPVDTDNVLSLEGLPLEVCPEQQL